MAKVIRRPGPGAAELKTLLESLEDCHVTVGWHDSAKYEDGHPAAYNAMIHENGVVELNIPAHPMLRPTVERCREKWRELSQQGAKRVRAGRMTARDVLEMLGGHAAGEVQRTIGEITSPALKEETILARQRKKLQGQPIGSITKPMMETAFLHATVGHEVGDGKGDKE